MYLVESIQQFESFLRVFESEDSFCIPILLDSRKHPIENEPSLLYFKLLDSRKSYMLPINHSSGGTFIHFPERSVDGIKMYGDFSAWNFERMGISQKHIFRKY